MDGSHFTNSFENTLSEDIPELFDLPDTIAMELTASPYTHDPCPSASALTPFEDLSLSHHGNSQLIPENGISNPDFSNCGFQELQFQSTVRKFSLL